MTPLIGFAPDADPTTPGVITDCTHLIPSEKGMTAAPSAVNPGHDALVDDCRGAAVLINTQGIRRTVAGTQGKLYELSSNTWTDVSTGTYTGSTENRWMFAQFGNVALAANDVVALQASTAGTFATIAGAPIARMIVGAENFALAFDTSDATYGDSPDRWWCSAFQDPYSWTASVTTQATTGRLIGSGGQITAAARFGSQVIAYKRWNMFVGQYVGAPIVWQWDRVPGEVGCVGPEAVADIGGAHIFVGDDNIWLYDGTRPVPISQNFVRQWFYDNSSATYRYRTIVTYDRQTSRVWFFYPSTSNSDGTPDAALVYHIHNKRWGRSNRTVEAAINYITPGVTWDTLSTLSATWDSLPDVPWDSQSWQAQGQALGVFTGSNVLVTLSGTGEDCGMTTGDYGDDFDDSMITMLRLRFLTSPATATCQGFYKNGEGDSLTTGATSTYSGNKFDIRQTAKFHRFAFNFTGNMEATGISMRATPAGGR